MKTETDYGICYVHYPDNVDWNPNKIHQASLFDD